MEKAKSISDEMMDLVDRLGSEAADVDPRAWAHLMVYAPKPDRIVTHNPHTGEPRDPRDIASDPAGTLIVDPSAPLKAAA